MCLILFSLRTHPRYKLVLAANRDEYFERPSLPADYWKSDLSVLGGLDGISGGTWLGITRTGRFAAITNYRNPLAQLMHPVSRGIITSQFLQSRSDTKDFLSKLSPEKDRYNGFNLLISDDAFDSLHYYSNVSNNQTIVSEGVHGLSNALLDTSWPKVDHGISTLSQVIKNPGFKLEDLIILLSDQKNASAESLPKTGISLELERKLSPVFISMKGYGTRCSTAIRLDYNNNLEFLEVSYDELAKPTTSMKYDMHLDRHKKHENPRKLK